MSEWVDWLRWGAPELARRVNALDASPVRRGGGPVHAGFGAASPARDAVIALQQDARRTVREREALHRGALKAGLPRLGLTAGCDFLAATAAAVSIVEHFPGRGERKDGGQQEGGQDGKAGPHNNTASR